MMYRWEPDMIRYMRDASENSWDSVDSGGWT